MRPDNSRDGNHFPRTRKRGKYRCGNCQSLYAEKADTFESTCNALLVIRKKPLYALRRSYISLAGSIKMYHPPNTVPSTVKTAGFSRAGIDHSTTEGTNAPRIFTNDENRKKWRAIWRASSLARAHARSLARRDASIPRRKR